MDEKTLALHMFALNTRGYTVLKRALDPAVIPALTAASDRAMEHAIKINRERGKIEGFNFGEDFQGVRCLHLWCREAMELLEHDNVHTIAQRAFNGNYHLWDLSVLSTPPSKNRERTNTTPWHRDMDVWNPLTDEAHYMHCFVYTMAVTPENGATWAIPGSHFGANIPKELEEGLKSFDHDEDLAPVSVRLCGEPGDMILFYPTVLHAAGFNHTDKPRRLVHFGLCHTRAKPFIDHWSIIGSEPRAVATPRLKKLLDPGAHEMPKDWPCLPPWFKPDPAPRPTLSAEAVA
ncbi:MAG: phytanoyl-CoA dioxygenase family protein [Planctomycetes bacterium]|nr:phytanoyl-CoA dioxygenase family protein [Planctomycetota bacterium]